MLGSKVSESFHLMTAGRSYTEVQSRSGISKGVRAIMSEVGGLRNIVSRGLNVFEAKQI